MSDSDKSDLDMRRDFSTRAELVAYLRREFPRAAERDPPDHTGDAWAQGGRRAAEERLHAIDVARYASTRNSTDGAVTRLSPYLRYGVVSLAQVRDRALRGLKGLGVAAKFVQELAWRDYMQRFYAKYGDAIWQDLEESKTGLRDSDYTDEMPADVERSETGLVCIDSFTSELRASGYLHNHARMWLAAYLVHWRRVRWQTGARWFLTHLLDGDPASNNLGWQWIVGTFAPKPYIFNRENLERYTDRRYCKVCPLYGRCDFEGTYEELSDKLFPHRAANELKGGADDKRRGDGRAWSSATRRNNKR